MAMFNGASVGTVEFDFTDFGMPDQKGVIPEPSRHLMSDVMDEVQEVFRKVRGEDVDPDDIDNVKEALDRVGEEYSRGLDIGEMTDALVVPIARLCGNVPQYKTEIEDGEEIQVLVGWDQSGGHPTYDAIDALGFRIFLAFMSYVMEQMTSPEASSAGSRRASTTNTPPTPIRQRQIRQLRKR